MEGVVETPSQEYPTQEFNNRVAAAEAGAQPEFVTVTNKRTVHWLKFPVSCFAQGFPENKMIKWAIETLKKVATPKPNSFAVTKLPQAKGDPEPFLIFQVYTEHEAKAACEHGATNEEGQVIKFGIFTPEAQALQQGRVLKIISLSFDTTANQIAAALSIYGSVESVATKFNAKATMINATVIFKSADAIDSFEKDNRAYIQVRDDIGTVTWMGSKNIPYDRSLTMKLACLPIGSTPVEIMRCLNEQFNTPNAVQAFHSITMPLNLYTKKRQSEAYIHFSSLQQRTLLTAKPLMINTYPTCWAEVNEPICRHCGHPSHFVLDCPVKSGSDNVMSLRRAHIAVIKGSTQTLSTAPRPFTQVPNTNTPTTTRKQPSFARATSTKSYASAASASKNRGSAASNPITIGTPTPSASPSSPTGAAPTATSKATSAIAATAKTALRPGAANVSLVSTSTPVNWVSFFNTQVARLEQQYKDELAAIRAEIRAEMRAEFNSLKEMLRGTIPTAAIKEDMISDDNDIVLDQAPLFHNNTVVPSSLLSTLSADDPPHNPQGISEQQAHQRSTTPPVRSAPYSVLTQREHSMGGTALGKSGEEREDSPLTRKHKFPHGKAPVRYEPQSSTTNIPSTAEQRQQEQINELQTMVQGLMDRNKALEQQLQAQQEGFIRYQQTLNDLHPAVQAHLPQDDQHQWAAITSQEIREYGGVAEYGSTGNDTQNTQEYGITGDGALNTDIPTDTESDNDV